MNINRIIRDYGHQTIRNLLRPNSFIRNQLKETGRLSYNAIFREEGLSEDVTRIRKETLESISRNAGFTSLQLQRILESTESKGILKDLMFKLNTEIEAGTSIDSILNVMDATDQGEMGSGGCSQGSCGMKSKAGRGVKGQFSEIPGDPRGNFQCFNTPYQDRYGAIKIKSTCVKKKPKILTSEEKRENVIKDRYIRQLVKLEKYQTMEQYKLLYCNMKALEELDKIKQAEAKKVFTGRNGQHNSPTINYNLLRTK